MNHGLFLCGQLARRQLARHRAHRHAAAAPPAAARAGTAPGPARSATIESTISKNSGAAASHADERRDCPAPAKLPTQTASTYGPNTPAVHASRKPHEVPVFHATGSARAAGAGRRPGAGCLAQHVERDEARPRGSAARARRARRRGSSRRDRRSGRSTPPFASIAYSVTSSSIVTSPPPSTSAEPVVLSALEPRDAGACCRNS